MAYKTSKGVKIILDKFNTVGELAEALQSLPPKIKLDPLGDPDTILIYVPKEKRAYLDNEDFFYEEGYFKDPDDDEDEDE